MNVMPIGHYFSNTCRHSLVSRQGQHTVNMAIIGKTALPSCKTKYFISSRGHILVAASSNYQKRAAIHITVLLQHKKTERKKWTDENKSCSAHDSSGECAMPLLLRAALTSRGGQQ